MKINDLQPTTAATSDGSHPRITQILRAVGAVLILASASTFLLQQWDNANHTLRYLFLLAHTLFLAGAGFFCGLAMKEGRSARTLFAIALAVVPAQFGVLAGLVYSRFALDTNVFDGPAFATWIAQSDTAALGLVGPNDGCPLTSRLLCLSSFGQRASDPVDRNLPRDERSSSGSDSPTRHDGCSSGRPDCPGGLA